MADADGRFKKRLISPMDSPSDVSIRFTSVTFSYQFACSKAEG